MTTTPPTLDALPVGEAPAALVTGAGRRLGRAVALALAERGYDVAVHFHRSREEADEVVRGVEARGRRGLAVAADLFAADAADRLMDAVEAAFPRLELVVNNASIFEPGSLLETTPTDFDQNLAIHLRTPFFLIQRLAARWVPAGFGRAAQGAPAGDPTPAPAGPPAGQPQVINLLDTRVARDVVDHFAYTVSKKALHELTRLAARALAPHLRVNAVAPGVILPPPGATDAYLARRAATVPLGRVGAVEDVVRAVCYLLDNPFVTGETLYVDGGEHLR
jgi:pteridine reductase